jgi:DNA-binding transcriptional MerR regulator
MYRPKDVAERLEISPATLRLWSTKFESYLSPGAQRSTTENGGASQRRYDDVDLAYFLRAKQLLAEGLTYEEVSARLADGVPIVERDNMRTDTQESLPVPLISDVVVVSEDVTAYQKMIAALEQTIQAQQSTITTQQQLIEALRERPVPSQTPSLIELPPMTLRQRLDWLLTGRMIAGTQKNGAEPIPEDQTQRQLPVQELA